MIEDPLAISLDVTHISCSHARQSVGVSAERTTSSCRIRGAHRLATVATKQTLPFTTKDVGNVKA